MSLHLQRDLDHLKKEILQLGSMVETVINNAIISLTERRPELAERVFEEEKLINSKEVLIEEDCLKILALHQPVAVDLRFIVVVLKVNNDLERMGDLAVNVAKRAIFLASKEPIPCPIEFTDNMPKNIRTMVHDSLDALVKLDLKLACKVIAMDDEVDDVNRQMYAEAQKLMEDDPSTIKRAIGMLSSSRYLERIADLATNIAEDVIFMVEGEVVRHQIN
ncbi:MAG: phosphate transport system regulatory protein PhoU [Alteromonadaceae bacterium]|nr:MAG: phosphate transport system regulatory protein PhoU [Alteromonadaceae bacterium]